jgi:signal transduction histidine kinase/CheY-like chemotaxis protein
MDMVWHEHERVQSLEMTRRLRSGDLREFTQEKRYVRKDGIEVWVSATKSAMWTPGAKPDFFITIAQDITAQKQLEQQFLQAQKMEAIGTLAGGIAHDFNNILTAIVGFAELGRTVLTDNPEVREYLGAILQASRRASDLVRQILTFSRQERPERSVIALKPVMVESLKLLRASLPTSIAFEIELAADAPTVLADATQVHQVLMNLGTNAWHAMKDRPGRLRVKLTRCAVDAELAATQSRLRPGLYARVTVGDTGCGMDDVTLRRMFEPFFTTKPTGEGTGLGLAVVHGVMESHDAAVTVVSQPGQGTEFELYCPAHAGEAGPSALADEPVARGHGESILVVDDEEILVRMLTQALIALGYRVEATCDPAFALELVRADPQRFALLLTDQTMPGLTGLALARMVRQIQPDLPVILMTGYGVAALSGEIQAAGIRLVLDKPMRIVALGVAMRSALPPQSLP